MRTLYTVAVAPAAAASSSLRLWLRGRREPGYREGVGERFGVYRGEQAGQARLGPRRLGGRGARRGAAGARARRSDCRTTASSITCTTAAGRETLKQVYGDSILAAFLPYDFPEAVQAFLAHFSPRLGVLMETEIWPNLLAGLRARRRAGACWPTRACRRSRRAATARWRSLAGPAFGSLALVCAQSDADAARLRSLGARRVEVTGNLKFDVGARRRAARRRARLARRARPPGAAARQHARKARKSMLLKEIPDGVKSLLVVVVPRHPQRFDEVAPLAQSRRTRAAGSRARATASISATRWARCRSTTPRATSP